MEGRKAKRVAIEGEDRKESEVRREEIAKKEGRRRVKRSYEQNKTGQYRTGRNKSRSSSKRESKSRSERRGKSRSSCKSSCTSESRSKSRSKSSGAHGPLETSAPLSSRARKLLRSRTSCSSLALSIINWEGERGRGEERWGGKREKGERWGGKRARQR